MTHRAADADAADAVAADADAADAVAADADVPDRDVLDRGAATEDALRALVAVMDRLRSPGGCPWDAEQTHATLVRYCLEEAYEVAEAIESGDRDAMREELGDLLLQVVFHARIAQEDPIDPFDLDDVARGVADKLVRRHPHVFGGVKVSGPDQVRANWEDIKRAEKQRESVLDGIPRAQGALARAAMIVGRARRGGLPVDVELLAGELADPWAVRLLSLVVDADGAGVDAETALRSSLDRIEEHIRLAERSAASGGSRT